MEGNTGAVLIKRAGTFALQVSSQFASRRQPGDLVEPDHLGRHAGAPG